VVVWSWGVYTCKNFFHKLTNPYITGLGHKDQLTVQWYNVGIEASLSYNRLWMRRDVFVLCRRMQPAASPIIDWRGHCRRYWCLIRAKLHYTDTGYEHRLRTPPTDELITILQQICHIAMPEPMLGCDKFLSVGDVHSRCPCSAVRLLPLPSSCSCWSCLPLG